MATITLYKSKVNGVGSLIDDIIKSSNNLDTQLGTLKNTLMGIDSSTCNLQETVDSISASSKSEKEKVEDLKKLNKKLSDFIEMTTKREASAKAEIEKKKNDFYSKYYYLKPECEKSGWEKFCDGVKAVCDWCAEHWKLLVTIAIVAIAIAVLFIPGVGPIISGACWGAIFGALLGGLSGGVESLAKGGSFWEGFENGAFSGAISGAIMGGAMAGLGVLGQAAGRGLNALYKGAACVSKLGKVIKTTAVVTKVMSYSMMGFDLLALGDKAFGFAGGKIAALNTELHKSKAYNYFQLGVSAVAAFTGGMVKTMKCFVAGTLVLTASGLVAIEKIKEGDLVYAADENSLQIGLKRVVETYVRKTNRLVHLIVDGVEVVSTFDHPFYVNNIGFTNAGALCIGAELVSREGKILHVEQVYREELGEDNCIVYNLNIEDFHTYFVSKNMILVHNAKYDVGKYNEMSNEDGLDKHHVPQKAAMKKLDPNYDPAKGPSIKVPKEGHTIKGPRGIVSRSTKGINSPAELIMRDIAELKRVYPDIPESSINELISMFKGMGYSL